MGTSTPIKYKIKESFSGTRSADELFADIILSEIKGKEIIAITNFTMDQSSDTLKTPTVKSNLCCLRKETL